MPVSSLLQNPALRYLHCAGECTKLFFFTALKEIRPVSCLGPCKFLEFKILWIQGRYFEKKPCFLLWKIPNSEVIRTWKIQIVWSFFWGVIIDFLQFFTRWKNQFACYRNFSREKYDKGKLVRLEEPIFFWIHTRIETIIWLSSEGPVSINGVEDCFEEYEKQAFAHVLRKFFVAFTCHQLW